MTSGWAPYWGKTPRDRAFDKNNPVYHLLAYHCLDVAAAGHELLRCDPSTCRRLAERAGLEPDEFMRLVTFLLALHDVGKFEESFQALHGELFEHLRGHVSARSGYPARHDALGFVAWRAFLENEASEQEWFDLVTREDFDDLDRADVYEAIFAPVFGHHGYPINEAASEPHEALLFTSGDPARGALASFVQDARALLLGDQDVTLLPDHTEPIDDATCRLRRLSWSVAGLYVLSDWIGSDQTIFTPETRVMPLKDYWHEFALPRARRAVKQKRWEPTPTHRDTRFDHLFPSLASYPPRPLQQWALATEIAQGPQLFVLEDETGSGKTESAIILAHRLMAKDLAQGIFIGLPTMATANAMFERFCETYKNLFAEGTEPSIVLAHASRHLSERFSKVLDAGASLGQQLATNASTAASYGGSGDEPGEATCAAWFTNSRHVALYADVGVGTVDQAMLSVLSSKHQSLKYFALGRRVLIIDEIHACDTYMNTIVCNLLEHHAAQGGSAILLSATLASGVRAQLCGAYRRGLDARVEVQEKTASALAYPLATHVSAERTRTIDVIEQVRAERAVDKTTSIAFFEREEQVDAWIVEQAPGRAVCWIRNTVHDAIEAKQRLDALYDPDRVLLFHARMAMCDRARVEQQILDVFGKKGTSDARHGWIVVATQVIEQSLDVDFDEMVTDLAPIDLIIQRLGRMRRHARDVRGALLSEAEAKDERGERTLHVLAPPWEEQPTSDEWYAQTFSRASWVYRHLGQLWRTMHVLRHCGPLTLPSQSRALVEDVFDDSRGFATPDVFADRDFDARIEEHEMEDEASFVTLDLDHGYRISYSNQNAWAPETRTPTRYGPPSSRLRLCRCEAGHVEPWADPAHHHAWEMSEVSVMASRVAYEDKAPSHKSVIANARRQMRDRAKYALIIPLYHDPECGDWRGPALDGRGQRVTVCYDARLGLRVESGAYDPPAQWKSRPAPPCTLETP